MKDEQELARRQMGEREFQAEEIAYRNTRQDKGAFWFSKAKLKPVYCIRLYRLYNNDILIKKKTVWLLPRALPREMRLRREVPLPAGPYRPFKDFSFYPKAVGFLLVIRNNTIRLQIVV